MRHPCRRLMAIVTCLAAFAVATVGLGVDPAAAAPTTPAVGVQFHGMWSDYTDAQRIEVLDKMAAAGVTWVRLDLGWSSFQEVSRDAYSSWYIRRADFIVDAARARGIKVLGTLWQTPAWANGGRGMIVPPTDANDYARFAGWAAGHFRGRVSAWEVWNEPNHSSYFAGTVSQYVGLLRAAYPALKAGDPAAPVVFGGPDANDTTYLAAAYAAGAAGSFDVMATHPYMSVADAPPELPDDGTKYRLSHVAAVKRLMDVNGDGHKPIWFTEFGWSSHANTGGEANWQRGVTLAQQADYLVRTIRYVRDNFPYVTNIFWFKDRNGATGTTQIDNYGLLNRDLSPKPVYEALRAELAPAGRVGARSAQAGSATGRAGYWMVGRTGAVYAFGDAPHLGNAPAGSAATVDLEPTRSGSGYWIVDAAGRVSTFGDAGGHGDRPALLKGEKVTSLSRTGDDRGYWMFTTFGRVMAYGNAPHLGDMAGTRLNGPVLDSIVTPSGNGYYMVASDGGIFAFGDAAFYGSMGDTKLNAPVQSIVPDPDGVGYWLVASDGGIFAFDAPFHGSMGGTRLNRPITGMIGVGQSYFMVGEDGGIFSFGDAPYLGSLGDQPPSEPIVAAAVL